MIAQVEVNNLTSTSYPKIKLITIVIPYLETSGLNPIRSIRLRTESSENRTKVLYYHF